MTRSVSTRDVQGRPLDNAEAAVLINMILDETPSSAPAREAKNSSRSLADIFPVSVLAAA